MADPLPPDPYLALGVAKDATAAAIKTQYRKLVLKCHPDKVKDESEKKEASDKFHKIQSAWEIIGDDARRARYDAQAKLQELRRDVFGHHGEGRRSGGGSDVRTASYKFPTESPRGGDFYTRGPDRYGPKMSPQYEERTPSYAEEESYFDERPRPAARKYDEYDRTPKRAPPREERERPRAKESKENRKEKSRRTDKDIQRDRERKQAYVEVEPDSDYDEYPRARRSSPEDENLDRLREKFWNPPDPYARETVDDRARRTYDKMEEARAHIERSRGANRQRGESEPRDPSPREARRPSPVRQSSSKDKIERTSKRADARPGLFSIRHGSGDRPKMTRGNTGTGKNSKSDNEKKSSDEERRSTRRKEESRDSKPPNLSKSKSQPPADVRPPFQRQRSHSMQDEQHVEEPPVPHMRRSETTPLSPSTGVPPSRESRRKANDRLHPDMAYPSPDPTPEPEPQKFRYGREQTYADDGEFATPDGYVNPNAEPYRTQVYEPTRETQRQSTRDSRNPRMTRSPSPMKDADRQARRSSSSRHTPAQKPPMPRTTSTQYVVEPEGVYARPTVSREDSGRLSSRGLSRENSGHKGLYGEIPRAAGARSGSPRAGYTFPPPDEVKYARRYNEADFKVQSGYSRRETEKPTYTRTGSGLRSQPIYA